MTREDPLTPDMIDWQAFALWNGPDHRLDGLTSYMGLSQLATCRCEEAAISLIGIVDVGGHYARPAKAKPTPRPPCDHHALSKASWSPERRIEQSKTMKAYYAAKLQAQQDALAQAGIEATPDEIQREVRRRLHRTRQSRWRAKCRANLVKARQERRAA